MQVDLTGQRALVTGASRGIGRAIAGALIDSGARIVAHYRNDRAGAEAVVGGHTGSVAIAGPQTAAYPIASPGGWWLIGRTDLVLWDPRREPPAILHPGRLVRFVPR